MSDQSKLTPENEAFNKARAKQISDLVESLWDGCSREDAEVSAVGIIDDAIALGSRSVPASTADDTSLKANLKILFECLEWCGSFRDDKVFRILVKKALAKFKSENTL